MPYDDLEDLIGSVTDPPPDLSQFTGLWALVVSTFFPHFAGDPLRFAVLPPDEGFKNQRSCAP